MTVVFVLPPSVTVESDQANTESRTCASVAPPTAALLSPFKEIDRPSNAFAARVSTNTLGDLDTWTVQANWLDTTGKYHRHTYTLCFLPSYDIGESDDGLTSSGTMTVFGTDTPATDRT